MADGGLTIITGAVPNKIPEVAPYVTLGLLAVGLLLVLIILGMHVAIALFVIAGVSIWVIRDNPDVAVRTLRSAATGTIDKFEFGVVPLFVLMGLLSDISDIGRDAYKVAAWWTRRISGGLGIATVVANAIFPPSPAYRWRRRRYSRGWRCRKCRATATAHGLPPEPWPGLRFWAC